MTAVTMFKNQHIFERNFKSKGNGTWKPNTFKELSELKFSHRKIVILSDKLIRTCLILKIQKHCFLSVHSEISQDLN